MKDTKNFTEQWQRLMRILEGFTAEEIRQILDQADAQF